MEHTINLKILKITLLPSRTIRGNGSKLMGFFATKFNEYSLLHQHDGNKYLYRYPLVQYKIIEDVPIIIGINDGADVLKNIYDEFEEIKLGEDVYKIIKTFLINNQAFGIAKDKYTYRFAAPWFALDQNSYNRYKHLENLEDRNELLRKRLNSDIIRMSNKLGYRVPELIKSEIYVKERSNRFKGKNIVTFHGGFRTNFIIPDYLGIGKSVSRGFGTIKLEE